MSAKRIGELLPGILARAEAMAGFQQMLGAMPDNRTRKTAIMDWRKCGYLNDEQTGLLITAHMLEDA